MGSILSKILPVIRTEPNRTYHTLLDLINSGKLTKEHLEILIFICKIDSNEIRKQLVSTVKAAPPDKPITIQQLISTYQRINPNCCKKGGSKNCENGPQIRHQRDTLPAAQETLDAWNGTTFSRTVNFEGRLNQAKGDTYQTTVGVHTYCAFCANENIFHNFRIAMEMPAAGCFDDVCGFWQFDGKNYAVFIQVKLREQGMYHSQTHISSERRGMSGFLRL